MVEKSTRDGGDGVLPPARVETGDSLCGVDFLDGVGEGVVKVCVGGFAAATLSLEAGDDEVELQVSGRAVDRGGGVYGVDDRV
jgi:hypothetical protein